jgi:hypothetical protein
MPLGKQEWTMLEISRRADFSEIPLIDIGSLGTGTAAEANVVASIRAASEYVGFFYAINHLSLARGARTARRAQGTTGPNRKDP